MELEVKLEELKVAEVGGSLELSGMYSLYNGKMEVASQGFNNGYDKPIKFSDGLMCESASLQKQILSEITSSFEEQTETIKEEV